MQGLSITDAQTLRLIMRKKENTLYDKDPLKKKNAKNPPPQKNPNKNTKKKNKNQSHHLSKSCWSLIKVHTHVASN